MRPEERYELFLLAERARGIVVVLGCYQGLSTLYLVGGALSQRAKKGAVFSVDYFKGEPESKYRKRFWANPEYVRGKYIENIQGAGFIKLVTLMQMDTVAAAQIDLGEVSLLFIDADHSYAGTLNDFTAWYPKITTVGSIAMHNATGTGVDERQVTYPGIMKVFAEAILEGRLLEPRMVGTMGIGIKP